jgi:hypothetical protein
MVINPERVELQGLFVDGFILLPHEPRIHIPRSSTIRNVTGHVAEGTGLLAGWASFGYCISPKCITTIRTFSLRHEIHHPLSDFKFQI